MPNLPILSFNTGEVSPLIDARSDVAKYSSACRILQNMIPRIYGIASRRPGTKFIKLTQNPNVMSRLFPFIYSEEIAYIVEHGDQSARFFYDGGELVDGSGNHVSVATPYLSADLNEIHYKQSNDVQWLVHKSYIPRKLTRTTATSFSLDTIIFTGGPFLKRHDLDVGDGVTLTPSVTVGSGTLTASADTFEAGHVGSVWQLTQPRVLTDISGSRTSAGVLGTPRWVDGVYTFSTSGTWKGTVRIQRSEDAGVTWETVKTYTQQALYTGTESGIDVQYRINVTSLDSGKIYATLSVNSSTQDGIVRITGYNSATEVTYTVDKRLASTDATVRWAEGAWSGVRGYPRTMTFFEERTVYAGTLHQPQTIWLSGSGKYECFKEGTADSDAFSLTLSSDTRNAILWITALEALVFGTSGGEWRLRSSRFDEPLTPTNYSIKQQTTKGSKAIQALQVDAAVLFVDSVGRKVREMSLDSNTGEKYVAPDLNALAEHITETGIVAIAHQKNPDSILWAVRDDGYLLSMTYEREQDVVAWARQIIGDVDPATTSTSPDTTVTTNYPTLRAATDQDDPGLPRTTPISSIGDLQDIDNDLAGNYYLVNDIDLSVTADPGYNSGRGWESIGGASVFTGTLDGCGYAIKNMTQVTDLGPHPYTGLITGLSGAKIANLYLTDVDMTCHQGGPLAQLVYGGSEIYNCHVTGNMTVRTLFNNPFTVPVGGFIGWMPGHSSDEPIYDSSTSVNITITNPSSKTVVGWKVGGFIGYADGYALIQNCSASGNVDTSIYDIATQYTGGFIGFASDTSCRIRDCNASGNVSGGRNTGGFIGGGSSPADIDRCFATGNVTATNTRAGGFIGFASGLVITDCYARGNVTGTTYVGGFIGSGFSSYCSNCYSTGKPTGTSNVGGFLGGFTNYNIGVTSYWDTQTSETKIGVTVLYAFNGADYTANSRTTIQMIDQDNYVGWDFDTIWEIPITTIPGRTRTGIVTESVVVIPGDGEDEVWLIIKRVNINGIAKREIVQMQPRDFGDQEDAWFCDSALDYTGVATSVFTNLEHLEGEEVGIWGNGAIFTRQTVVNGSVALDSEVTRAIVGLPFRYILKPMRFDLQMRSGTTKGSTKKIGEAVISFYETLMAKYGKDVDHLLSINWRTTEPHDSPPDMHTGDKIAVADGGYDPEDGFIITSDDPAPCSVRSIVLREKITGR